MEQIRMPNMSNGLIKITNGESCDKHPEAKIFDTPSGLVCIECQREKIIEEDKLLGRKALLAERLRKTSAMLEHHSIIVDETIREASLSNYGISHTAHEPISREIKDIANSFVKGSRGNVWLVGEPGAGKSHVAMSILKAVNEFGRKKIMDAFEKGQPFDDKGYSCLFMTIDVMFRMAKNSFNDRNSPYTELYFVNLCSSVDLLVIDDLGAESGSMNRDKEATNFTQTILYAIANGRQDKATIITTNLKKDQRVAMYDAKMLSRLTRGNKEVVFKDMPDMRPKNESAW